MQISKWGNSLAIRIPARVVSDLELKEGDDVVLKTNAAREIVVMVPATRRVMLDNLRKFRGTFPQGFKFDREEANSREPDTE